MKESFTLGAVIRTVGTPHRYGRLVEGPPRMGGWEYPHYSGEGWYYVRWDERSEIYVAREDDIELAPEPHRPLYKTTIVIWSETDPNPSEASADPELDSLAGLALEATNGNAYCSKMHVEAVNDPARDPDWDGTEFFLYDHD